MISQNPYSNCMNARLYYYDFLSEEIKKSIPESILSHIDHCPDCQAEIDRLETLLANVDEQSEDQENRRNSAITTLLKFHFSYVNEPVTCNTVKPFLASLVDPVLELLIPTPITEHIDKCLSCRADLRTLQDLHLTHKQLCRLGQLLAETPTEDTANCPQARQVIPAVASMVFRKTNAEVLKHLSTCTDCREVLFRHREGLCGKLADKGTDSGPIPCKAVSSSDIYDYAFPYGIDPSDDEYAEFREPLASHIGECPRCLAKVQELQKTIYGIVERSESDVVTVYHLDEPIADHTQPRASIHFTERLRRTISSPKIKPWLRASVAAAAVVIIGLVFMFNEPTVSAVSLDQMSNAIEKEENIHTITFVPDRIEPTQERWVSRSLQIYLSKNEKGVLLSDFANKLQKERQLGSDSVVEKELTEDALAAIERNVAAYLNILPLRISEMSNALNWHRVTDISLGTTNENIEVYDLTWIDKTHSGYPEYYERRYFFDSQKSLPNKVEFYKKSSKTGEPLLQSTVIIERKEDSEMKSAVENAFP